MKKKWFAMLKLTEVKAWGMILSTYQSLPHSPTYLSTYLPTYLSTRNGYTDVW